MPQKLGFYYTCMYTSQHPIVTCRGGSNNKRMCHVHHVTDRILSLPAFRRHTRAFNTTILTHIFFFYFSVPVVHLVDIPSVSCHFSYSFNSIRFSTVNQNIQNYCNNNNVYTNTSSRSKGIPYIHTIHQVSRDASVHAYMYTI